MNNLVITCLGADCPERRCISCGGRPTTSVSTRKGTRKICNNCGKDFIGGKCTATPIRTLGFELIKLCFKHDITDPDYVYEMIDLIRKYD